MDACAKKVKASVAVWPSARASQLVAKCRKAHGIVRKGSAGRSLRRWGREKWENIHTRTPCGASSVKNEYCRPTKRVSKKKTPVMRPSAAKIRKNYKRKRAGKRAARV
jgi:hypothetical protein